MTTYLSILQHWILRALLCKSLTSTNWHVVLLHVAYVIHHMTDYIMGSSALGHSTDNQKTCCMSRTLTVPNASLAA